MNADLDLVIALVASAGIGLLVGLERSRHPLAKAGVRTFTVIAVLGTVSTLLADRGGLAWLAPLALVLVGLALAGASLVDKATRVDDSGTTTIVSALLVFCLGALIAMGHRQLAAGIGIALTALLHFKGELEDFSRRLTSTDLRSMLQFGALAAIVLPLLPREPVDPLGAVSPFDVGLMAVLICAISLAGYVAWRLTSARGAVQSATRWRLLAQGVLGGLVSSTATTLAQARHGRAVGNAGTATASVLVVILLANATMLMRVLLLTLIVAPSLWTTVAPPLAAALLVALGSVALRWRAAPPGAAEPAESYRNPAQLGTAITFALIYAVVLLAAAWVQQHLGSGGVYVVALISGATDVDAITLSSLRLAGIGSLPVVTAAVAIACAVAANLVFKAIACAAAGGAALGRAVTMSFVAQIAAMIIAVVATRALA